MKTVYLPNTFWVKTVYDTMTAILCIILRRWWLKPIGFLELFLGVLSLSCYGQRSIPLTHEALLDDIFYTSKSHVVLNNSFLRFGKFNVAEVLFARDATNTRYVMCLRFMIDDDRAARNFVSQRGDFIHLYLNKGDTLRLENIYHAKAFADTPGFFPLYFGEMWFEISPSQLAMLGEASLYGIDIFSRVRQSPMPLPQQIALPRRTRQQIYRNMMGWYEGIEFLTPKSRKRFRQAANAIKEATASALKPASPQSPLSAPRQRQKHGT